MALGIASAGLSGLSSIVGGFWGANKAKKARQAQNRLIDQEDKRNEDYFKSEYYKNQLDRTENAAALNKAHDFIRDRAKIDNKTAAITGATPESVAAKRKADMGAYGNLVSQLASGASAQRDAIYNRYNQGKQQIFGLRTNSLDNQIQQGANMTQNAMNLGMNSALSLVDQLAPKKKTA